MKVANLQHMVFADFEKHFIRILKILFLKGDPLIAKWHVNILLLYAKSISASSNQGSVMCLVSILNQ